MSIHLIRRHHEGLRCWWALLLAAVVTALMGLGQVWQGIHSWPQLLTSHTAFGEIVRASADFGPNTLAAFIILVLPLAIVYWLFHRNTFYKLFNFIILTILLTGAVATFSAIGLMALVCTMSVLCLLIFRPSWRIVIYGLAALLITVSILFLGWPELLKHSFLEAKLNSISERLDYIQVGGLMLKEHPYLGWGPGIYKEIALNWRFQDMNVIGFITHPHALWLLILVENGIIGLVTVCWGLIKFGRYVAKKVFLKKDQFTTMLNLACLAGLIGVGVVNISEHGLVHDRGIHLAIAIGSFLVMLTRKPNSTNQEPRRLFDRAWTGYRSMTNWAREIEERQVGREALYELLELALSNYSQAKILELGCGPALDAIRLARHTVHEVHAADYSAAALKLAAEASRDLKQLIFLHQKDVRHTGFEDESFDLVFSQGLLEHFKDPDPVWLETARVLKAGGRVVVDVPQTLNPYTFIKSIHQLKGTWPWGWETQYTFWQLKHVAKKYDLELITARGYGYRGGVFDVTRHLKSFVGKKYPQAWKRLEQKTGAFWMMNIVALFKKKESVN